MRPSCLSLSLAGLAYGLSASSVLADLSAQDVWQDLKAAYAQAGFALSGDERPIPGGLRLANVSAQFEAPDRSVVLLLGDLAFAEQRDGTVAIEVPDRMALQVAAADAENNVDLQASMIVRHEDFVLRVEGDASERLAYRYQTPSITLEIDELRFGDASMPPGLFDLDATFQDISGIVETWPGMLRIVERSSAIGSAKAAISVTLPEDEGAIHVAFGATDMTGSARMQLPSGWQSMEITPEMLAAGYATDGKLTYQAMATQIEAAFPSSGDSGTVTLTSTDGRIATEISRDGVAVLSEQTDLTVDIRASAVPVPVDIDAGRLRVDIVGPALKADEAQDLAVDILAQDVVLADPIWRIFDPAGRLPRDPATLAVALAGQAKLLVNYLDTQELEAMFEAGRMPAALERISIERVLLQALGARIDATGALTFDNANSDNAGTLFDMPMPVGQINVELEGIGELIDTFVAMEILPGQQAILAQMALNFFTRAGEGEGVLTSEIAFTDKGRIIANGQRVR